MHSDKKPSMEDTWRPAELKRHIVGERPGGENVRRRNDNERKPRGGESVERRRRDPEKESRRERDEQKERGSTKERRHDEGKDGYAKPKEDSRDRRSDKDRDRRDERDKERRKERDRPVDDLRKRDREDKHERERDKERHRDKEKDRLRDRERQDGEERDKRREERDKERRREERDKDRRRGEQDREHHSEREKRRHEESGDGGRDRVEKYDREQRERHRERERPKDEREKERRERHGDRKHAEQKGEREHREEHKRHKEDRERRHKERGHDDQRQKHDAESRQHRDSKRPGEEERHHRGDREQQQQQQQQEREKQKERRHREEDDVEKKHSERRRRKEEDDDDDARRIHKDRSTSKKDTSEKSQRHDTNTEKTEDFEIDSEHQTSIVKDVGDTEEPDVNDEDLAVQEYEDDFEDYEEDFEDIDPSEGEDEKEPEFPQVEEGEEKDELTTQKRKEIEAIQRAMNEENERVGTAQSGHGTKRGEEDAPELSKGSERNQSRASQRGRFIDFVAAKQREVSKKVATKQKKRSTELLRLIDLDFSMTASLLDLPPVNEYDMYIRTFGNANTKQAYVQCNEDNADRDIQTEEIEVCEKWTQHPPEYSGSCGDPNLSQEARDKNMNEINFDSQRLAAFLRSASQVMVVLLEENQAERKSLRKLRNQTDALSFSDGSSQLNTQLSFLYGRHISLVHFSQVQSHTMMSVHTPTTTPSAVRLDSCTIICIWNIWEPSRPQRVLVYESEVQCCCFSPGKATLVFAGTSVGSVVLWDLREHAANHYCLKIGEDEWTFRQPTFSTDAVMASSGHLSSVSSVEVVPSTAAGGLRPEIPLLASEEESSGLSFQLASLDETGVLNFWVVVELPKASEAGSSTDLGLRPGGKVKLLHSSTLHTAERVSSRDAVKIGALQSLHLKFLPSDSNHFFIGTNMGLVRHGTSHGLKAPPKFYRFQEAGLRPVDVSSIHFSPFRPNLFLVGCGDGCIRLHVVSREQPVAEWSHSTAGERVVSLQWAQTRPTVFCVLDAASNLHIWDLLKNDTKPVITERISADRVTAMTVFGDSGKQNTYSGLALVHESGSIEMHYFTRDFTVSSCAEEEKLESMMTEAL
ncbi:cytoplasmic dynein 2 intermediate chain 1 isoform X1 [Solea solea]|uniref:cytoplasmic dynein 2 intermediate chain 1 isoform X1 n=1 Tax=Solea solea TaxID=90069 RepID=UPI00272BB11E|nr:cytoplasmic dynein 2 intermediate chain 1 isoform X1 [Solea solea]